MARIALPARFLVKMTEDDRARLAAVAAALSIDQSATIRFLIAEKYRALGIGATPPAPAKKKRRAS